MRRKIPVIPCGLYCLAVLLSVAVPRHSSAAPESGAKDPAAPADFASLVKALKGRWQYVSDPVAADDKSSFGPMHGEQVWRTSLARVYRVRDESGGLSLVF